jgi:hypothetical protein
MPPNVEVVSRAFFLFEWMGYASIVEDHPYRLQFFLLRIPPLCRLGGGVDSGLNGLGPLAGNDLDQTAFVHRIGLRPPEGGNEFGMGEGLTHRNLIQ